jgi:hypothetical protein
MVDWIELTIGFVLDKIQEIDFHCGHAFLASLFLLFVVLLYHTRTLLGFMKLSLFVVLVYSMGLVYQKITDAKLDFKNSDLFNERHCVSATQYYDSVTMDLCKEASRKLSMGVEGIAFELFHRDVAAVVAGILSHIFTPSVFYVFGIASICTSGWVIKSVLMNQHNNEAHARTQMDFAKQFAGWAARLTTRRHVATSVRKPRIEDYQKGRIEEIK